MTDVTTAPADEPEVDDDVEGRPAPFWQRLVAGSSTSIALILLALIVVFSAAALQRVLRDRQRAQHRAGRLGPDADRHGATYVIITAGIDLSVGGSWCSRVSSPPADGQARRNDSGVILVGGLAGLWPACGGPSTASWCGREVPP